jgi:hypothetical protein
MPERHNPVPGTFLDTCDRPVLSAIESLLEMGHSLVCRVVEAEAKPLEWTKPYVVAYPLPHPLASRIRARHVTMPIE